EGVVEEEEVGVRVASPSYADPLLLATGQVDAFLTNFTLISASQHLQIGSQCTGLYYLVVFALVERQSEEDVTANGQVLNPSLLRGVGYLEVTRYVHRTG